MVGGATPGLVVLSSIRKQTDEADERVILITHGSGGDMGGGEIPPPLTKV